AAMAQLLPLILCECSGPRQSPKPPRRRSRQTSRKSWPWPWPASVRVMRRRAREERRERGKPHPDSPSLAPGSSHFRPSLLSDRRPRAILSAQLAPRGDRLSADGLPRGPLPPPDPDIAAARAEILVLLGGTSRLRARPRSDPA